MHIVTIAIDGFGRFHDERLSPAPGLTVVRGPNEAGKTTMLAFTRAMLFGFPRGDDYPALGGGKRGGWLDLVMDDGRSLRVERYGERGSGKLRVIENDIDLGPGQLAAVLQGVETTVYQNIFAFGLGELTRFETLTDDEVAARIYGAGLGTGGVSGLKVEQSLAARMEALFKSGGSKPALNALLKRLEDIDRELDGADLPREYGEAGARLEAVITQLAELSDSHHALDVESRRQQRLKDGWRTWLELQRASQERAALGDVHGFKPDILERLSALETSLTESERAVEIATRAHDRAKADLDIAPLDEAALAQRAALVALAGSTKTEAARADERARNEREMAQARVAVEGALAGLGGGWTVDRVEAFDDSIAVKSEISGRFRTMLSGAEQATTLARDSHEAAEEQLEEANEHASAAATRVAEFDEALADRAPTATRERSLSEIESLAGELAAQRRIAAEAPSDDLSAARAALDERRSQARQLSEALRARQSATEMLPGLQAIERDADTQAQQQYLLPSALAIGGVVVAVVLALIEVTIAASLIVAVAGIGGAAAWIMVLRRQRPADEAGTREQVERRLADAEATIDRLGPALDLGPSPSGAEVDRFADDLDEERRVLEREEDRLERAQTAEREVERLETELGDAASAVGLPHEPDAGALEAFGRAITEDRETEAARAAAVEREEQLRDAAAFQATRVADLAAALEKRTQELAIVRAEWGAWLDAHGLERDYDRETAGRVVDSVTAAKGIVAALRKSEVRFAELSDDYDAYVKQVEALAPLLGIDRVDPDDVPATAALLGQRLADASASERARDELAHTLSDKAVALTAATETRDAASVELAGFLAETETKDVADLRAQVARTRTAIELDNAVAGARATLTTLSGPAKALEELLSDLDAVEDIADVEAALSHVAGELGDLDLRRDVLNQEAGSLRTSRAEMEADAAATELRQEREDVLSQLEAGARSWSVLALAHLILNRSRSVYEAAHRPAVIDKAERFFGAWTDGRYRRIIAPLGEDIRGAERIDGVEVNLGGLSRGTSEQLYLALRFGLVQHFVETSGEPLPIVMDDILVNFDAERAERAARSIEELAQTCQVIYFTCHDTTPLKADLEQTLPLIPVS